MGNDFVCSCGLRATYNEYGFFDGDAPFRSVAEWDDWQQEELRRRAEAGKAAFTDEGAELWQIREEHTSRCLEKGAVRLDKDALSIGDRRFSPETLGEPELCHLAGKETMMFSSPEGSCELRFRGSPSRRKYQLLLKAYQALRGGGAEK